MINSKAMLSLSKPTLVLDEDRARRNIARMAARAARIGVRFRPHFKTHQSRHVGRIFREFGIEAITVSSVDMAAYFEADGWRDILIAFPFNILEIREIAGLAARCRLGLLVESAGGLAALARAVRSSVDVWIKIDVGANRAGANWDDLPLLREICRETGRLPGLRLRGLLTHNGRTYEARTPVSLARVHAVGAASSTLATASDMGRFFLFLLTWITGNPLLAVVVIILLALPRRGAGSRWAFRLSRKVRSWREAGRLRRALSINPHDAKARTDLGAILARQGRFREARAELEQALPRVYDLPEANYYLGLSLMNDGEVERGRTLVDKALSINAKFGYGEPYLRLGDFRAERGEWAQPAERYRQATDVLRFQRGGLVQGRNHLRAPGFQDPGARPTT